MIINENTKTVNTNAYVLFLAKIEFCKKIEYNVQ